MCLIHRWQESLLREHFHKLYEMLAFLCRENASPGKPCLLEITISICKPHLSQIPRSLQFEENTGTNRQEIRWKLRHWNIGSLKCGNCGLYHVVINANCTGVDSAWINSEPSKCPFEPGTLLLTQSADSIFGVIT